MVMVLQKRRFLYHKSVLYCVFPKIIKQQSRVIARRLPNKKTMNEKTKTGSWL